MKKLWLILALVLSVVVVLAQRAFSRGEDPARPMLKTDVAEETAIYVPFRVLPDNMLAVRAKLDSIEGEFLFDNGSPVTIVNSRFFHPNKRNRTTYSHMTDVSGVPQANNDRYLSHELNMQGLVREGREYVAMDMRRMAQDDGVEVLGLIGYDFFEGYDVLFSYADSLMVLFQPESTRRFLSEQFEGHSISEVPIEMKEHLPCVYGQIGDEKYLLGIDCGSGGNVLSSTHHRQIAQHSRPKRLMEVLGVSRIPVRAQEVEVNRLDIGTKSYYGMNFLLHSLTSMIATDEGDEVIDGLVGYDFLSKQPTLISTTNKVMLMID